MKSRLVVDTIGANQRLKHFPWETVSEPLYQHVADGERFWQQKAETDRSQLLAPKGKQEAVKTLHAASTDTISKRFAKEIAGLDGHIAVVRTNLLGTRLPIDRARVELMASSLRDFTDNERHILYNSADLDTKAAMEAASTAVGPLPVKTREGGVQWVHLLSPDVVNESILERAKANDPINAEKLEELIEIRRMHESVAGQVLGEMRQVMADAGVRVG